MAFPDVNEFGRTVGYIRRFDPKHRYGFITLAKDGSSKGTDPDDIFFLQAHACHSLSLEPGVKVEFRVVEVIRNGQVGCRAMDIVPLIENPPRQMTHLEYSKGIDPKGKVVEKPSTAAPKA